MLLRFTGRNEIVSRGSATRPVPWRHFIGISAAIQTKKDEQRPRLRSTGKIYAKRRRHVADCRRSSDRKRSPCIFFVLRHVTGSLTATTALATAARLIENSIILFLSSGWRVLARIDSRIYNATWVSELTASTGCAHTELAYWTAAPASKVQLGNVLARHGRLYVRFLAGS